MEGDSGETARGVDSDCYNYFAGLLGRSKKTIVKPDENSIQYNHYLSESERWNNNKHQEQLMIGESLSEDVDIINFSKISNPKQNLKISEIDSHPDVVIQEGNRYIMKYVRKEITK